jgi:hypothetical protein
MPAARLPPPWAELRPRRPALPPPRRGPPSHRPAEEATACEGPAEEATACEGPAEEATASEALAEEAPNVFTNRATVGLTCAPTLRQCASRSWAIRNLVSVSVALGL